MIVQSAVIIGFVYCQGYGYITKKSNKVNTDVAKIKSF